MLEVGQKCPWCSISIPVTRKLRTFALIVFAHPYCARKFTCHVIHRARAKWTMIGQMAIAIAFLGFNDLGRLVTPTFLFRNILFTIISTLFKNEQKINVES